MSPFSFPVWNITVGREPVLWQCLIKKCFVYFSILWKLPFSWMHQLKSLIDFVKRQHVSYKFINLDLFGHVLSHQFRHIVYTLPAWKKENIPCFFPFPPISENWNHSPYTKLVWSIWKGAEMSDMFVPPMEVWQKHTLSKHTQVLVKNLSLAVPAFNIISSPHLGKHTRGISIRPPTYLYPPQ